MTIHRAPSPSGTKKKESYIIVEKIVVGSKKELPVLPFGKSVGSSSPNAGSIDNDQRLKRNME